jgi:PPOX class probable FMN-dependent enzyme
MQAITTVDELQAIYGEPRGASLQKEVPRLTQGYRAFVEAAPFVVMATSGSGGIDCSPKGDAPGFVRILDDQTIAIPDRLGNNRIDNLRNLVEDPRISLLFIIPAVGETLRVVGRAIVTADAELVASFDVGGKLPRSVIVVTIDSVFFHCSKALIRSKLWDAATWPERSDLPSAGTILAEITSGDVDAFTYDCELPDRIAKTLY